MPYEAVKEDLWPPMVPDAPTYLPEAVATPGENASPWRKEMLPDENSFGFERQYSTPGELRIGGPSNKPWPIKPFTPHNFERNFPEVGDTSFDDERIPKMSYRTHEETYGRVPYWSARPEIGPKEFPARMLFPRLPSQQEVENIEHDITPIPYSSDGGYAVMDLADFALGSGPATGAYLSGLGATVEELEQELAKCQATLETMRGMPTVYSSADITKMEAHCEDLKAKVEAAKAGNLDQTASGLSQVLLDLGLGKAPASVIDQAATLAANLYVQRQQEKILEEQRKLEEAKARAALATSQVGSQSAALDTAKSRLEPSKPFYESPVFLAGAALAVLGGGYLLLKR